MQIVSNGDSLHEMSNPEFEKNKKNISLVSAELAQRVVKVKAQSSYFCLNFVYISTKSDFGPNHE